MSDSPSERWRVCGGEMSLERPVVLGVLNLTPDSFSGPGRSWAPGPAVEAARQMLSEGADLVDVGGESTRPGAREVDAEEEWTRVGEVIRELGRLGLPVSVDTSKPEVARRALDAGAIAVNDVTALRGGGEMARVVGSSGAGLILMHMRGTPRTMQNDVYYADLLGEVGRALTASADKAMEHGVSHQQIVLDPGIGFGKSVNGNLEILNALGSLTRLGFPLLVGPSRKSFIGKVLDSGVDDRLEGTLAACVLALERGARLFRVHDVRPVRRALDMADAILRQPVPGLAT